MASAMASAAVTVVLVSFILDHRTPRADRRRALQLLASCSDGCTEAILGAHSACCPPSALIGQTGCALRLVRWRGQCGYGTPQ